MFSKVWLLSTGDRVGKSFLQGYLAFFMLASGLGDTAAALGTPSADAFDFLFTLDNVKAGVVMAVLSLLTNVATTPLGPDKDSPSLTVSENPPTVADDAPA